MENFPESFLKKLIPVSLLGLGLGLHLGDQGLPSPMSRTDAVLDSDRGCCSGESTARRFPGCDSVSGCCTGAASALARELDAGEAGTAVIDAEGTGSALQLCPLAGDIDR